RPPVAGKTCETGFERFSEQLCCEGNLFSFNPALKAEGKNPKAKSMCTIKKFSEFLLVKNSLANEVCEHS
ncbi:MAG: hypothetical protein IJJ71_10545, partial [Treponema sp.]|uniref:hypothetical protein n=1 Tax=Treponema sp. TaxID=166 RepID=UPI0025DDE891